MLFREPLPINLKREMTDKRKKGDSSYYFSIFVTNEQETVVSK